MSYKDELLYHIDRRIEELDRFNDGVLGWFSLDAAFRVNELRRLRDDIENDTINTNCPKCRDGFIMDLERGNRRCDCPKGKE